MQGVAAGSGAADAREQPASGRRRAARGPGRLRRDRQGGAQRAGARRDQERAHDARGPRDAARAVRQAGRRVRDPHGRAARADRELQPRAAVGDVGEVPRARRGRADDVRADDRRVLDLHRDPGDPAGHLRDVRRARAAAVRRLAARQAGRDRRARRHGRRPAAGGDDERGLRAVRRGRSAADRAPDRARATSTSGPARSTTRWRGSRPRRTTAARSRSACSATPPRSCRSSCAAARRSTS